MPRTKLLTCVVCLAACAPMTTRRRVVETSRQSAVERGAPKEAGGALTVNPTERGVLLASANALTCVERTITTVKRVEHKSTHPNKGFIVSELVLAAGLGGAGGFAIGDPDRALDETGWGAMPRTDENRDNIKHAGMAAAGVGAMFLTFAILNAFRGSSSRRALPDQALPAAKPGDTVACGASPRANDEVRLAIGQRSWLLGSTDKDGKLDVAWTALDAEAFDGDWRTATVRAGTTSAPIDLAAGRAAIAEREWTALAAAPSLETARRYQARFQGSHDADVTAMISQLADRTYAAELSQALARADLAKAKLALETWQAVAPDSTTRSGPAAEVAELERRGPADYLHTKFSAAIVAADRDPSKLAEAELALAVLAEIAPADPRLADANKVATKKRVSLHAARTKRAAAHASRARSHARHRELGDAELELAAALELAPDDKEVISTVAYVEKYRVKAGGRASASTKTTTAAEGAGASTQVIVGASSPGGEPGPATGAATTPPGEPGEQQVGATTGVNPTSPTTPRVDAKATAAAARAEQQRLAEAAKTARAEARAEKKQLAIAAKAAAETARAEAKAKAAEERVEKKRLAEAAEAARAEERVEKKRLAEAAEAARAEERAEQKRLAAAAETSRDEERAEKQRLAVAARSASETARAEAKAKAAEERAQRRIEAQAAGDAERARIAEERARAAEARAVSADEKTRARETARIASAERARLAGEERARKAADTAKAAELARLEKARTTELARKTDRGKAAGRPGPLSELVGLWASMIGHDAVWVVDLHADGTGRTAVWMSGHIVGFRAIAWRLDGDTLAIEAGGSAIRSAAHHLAGQLSWSGVAWRRQ